MCNKPFIYCFFYKSKIDILLLTQQFIPPDGNNNREFTIKYLRFRPGACLSGRIIVRGGGSAQGFDIDFLNKYCCYKRILKFGEICEVATCYILQDVVDHNMYIKSYRHDEKEYVYINLQTKKSTHTQQQTDKLKLLPVTRNL